MVNTLGKHGENIADAYLQRKGYHILERNYRSPYGEIDIICSIQQELVFVEVKTRRGTGFGVPQAAVTRRKQDHIRKSALYYLATVDRAYSNIRFDVIAILLKSSPLINHIEAAF